MSMEPLNEKLLLLIEPSKKKGDDAMSDTMTEEQADRAHDRGDATVHITLARCAANSRVVVDGVDITKHLMGFKVKAEVDGLTELVLTLSTTVSLDGGIARDAITVLQKEEKPDA